MLKKILNSKVKKIKISNQIFNHLFSNMKIKKTKYHSQKVGNLCKGCKQCVKGKKLVLFITGLCPRRCYFCPINEEKFNKNNVYANEWKIKNSKNPKELFKEIELTNAKGCGITGGDPLSSLDRTTKYIKILKEKYGKKFHIHLYTSLNLVTKKTLKELYDSGLDEIRFHPDLDDKKLWNNLKLAKEFDWNIGIEIPVVPDKEKQIKELINYFHKDIEFINLNELEFSDTKVSHYNLEGYKTKNDSSYAAFGSKELGLKILEYCKDKKLNAHFCTAKLKDSVQMQNRLERRAKRVAYKFDKITKEGLLIRACLYLEDLKPGLNYKENLKDKKHLKQLKIVKKVIIINSKLKEDDLKLDEKKVRLILSPKKLRKNINLFRELNLVPAIVEEYPTEDAFEVEVDFL